MKKELVSVEYLKKHLSKEKIVILDVSPKSTAMGKTSPFSKLCIPNARVVDLKENFTDKESDFPNTVPSPAQFERACQTLGINGDSEIVIYDNLGIYTSPRMWWLLKVMGHRNVSVLNGGLVEWIKEGGETIPKSNLKQDYKTGNFESNFQHEYLIKYEDILDNIGAQKFLVVDARLEGRFKGTAAEPRKHLQSGCIPNSINIPYQLLLENGKFKSAEVLHSIFSKAIDAETKLVFSCGSGMTACIVMLASEIAFQKSKYLYDGSWTEYAELRGLLTT